MRKLLTSLLALCALAWPALAQVVYSGNTGGVPPVNSIGKNNDYFLDIATGNIYGPKNQGVWPSSPSGTLSGGTGGSGTMTGVTLLTGANIFFSGTCTSTASINCTIGASTGTGVPGGTNGQLQFNSNGTFGGYTIGSGLGVSAGALITSGGSTTAGVNSLSTTCPTSTPGSGNITLAGGLQGRVITGGTDTIAISDCGLELHYTDNAAVAITVPQAGSTGAQLPANWYAVVVVDKNSGPVTLTTTTSTFSTTGTSTLTLPGGQSAQIRSDGTNYVVETGSAIAAGGVTSLSTQCTTSGPLIGDVVLTSGLVSRVISGTTDTVSSGDCGKLLIYANASATTVTVPQANSAVSLGANYYVTFVTNSNSGAVTFNTTTSTFSNTGTTSFQLGASQSATIRSDGTNYQVLVGSATAAPGGTQNQVQYNAGAGALGGYNKTGNGTYIGSAIASSGIAAGDCVQWDTNKNLGDAGSPCGSGGSGAPAYRTGASVFYQPPGSWSTASGSAMVANTIYCFQAALPQAVTINMLGGLVTTLATGGSIQFAIYSGTTGTLTLVDSTGSMTTNSAAQINASMNNGTDTLTAGSYWWCSNSNSTPAMLSFGSTSPQMSQAIGSTTQANVMTNNLFEGKSATLTFGSWPASFPFSSLGDSVGHTTPLMAFRVN